MRSGGPGERTRKLGMAFNRREMPLHAFLNALARALPAMFLGDPGGKSMDSNGALQFNDAHDEIPQNRRVIAIKESFRIQQWTLGGARVYGGGRFDFANAGVDEPGCDL